MAEGHNDVANTFSLAFREMYTLLANLFRRFELEIYNTTDDDMTSPLR
jgi:hemoglobin-like flavoprotein